MLERQSGSIINIASICGMGGTEFANPAYHASKAAVIQLTRQLAGEWADRGVRVNAISPGFFMSEMIREGLELTGTKAWIESRNPMRRMGEHQELAGPLVFLASDASSYVTGINMAVDGGHSAMIGAGQLQAPVAAVEPTGPDQRRRPLRRHRGAPRRHPPRGHPRLPLPARGDMTEAREAIADLVHRYSDAVTRHDIVQWSSCWADDARWALSPERTACGRDEIVALFERAISTLEGVVQNVLNGTCSVDGRTGHRPVVPRRALPADHRGARAAARARYDDTYVERERRWLFASRTLVPSYQGPPDLSGVFVVPERHGD